MQNGPTSGPFVYVGWLNLNTIKGDFDGTSRKVEEVAFAIQTDIHVSGANGKIGRIDGSDRKHLYSVNLDRWRKNKRNCPIVVIGCMKAKNTGEFAAFNKRLAK